MTVRTIVCGAQPSVGLFRAFHGDGSKSVVEVAGQDAAFQCAFKARGELLPLGFQGHFKGHGVAFDRDVGDIKGACDGPPTFGSVLSGS